PVN
ncbi:hypothetical protein LINPERHAP1_LOCUS16745, partial [Linum perenne]